MKEKRQNQDKYTVEDQSEQLMFSALSDAFLRAAEKKEQTAQEPAMEKTIDIVGFMFYVLEKFWCILLAVVLGAAMGVILSKRSIPTYTATAKLYIVSPASTSINLNDLQLGSVLTRDYLEVFKTWEVHEMVREKLNLTYSYEQMQSFLNVTNPEETRVLYVTVIFYEGQMAANMANAYAEAAKTFITNTMKGEEPSDFSIALAPEGAMSQSPKKTIINMAMLFGVLAVGGLFLVFVLDDRPRTPEDIRACAGIPTLAVLPVTKETREERKDRRKRQESGRRR